MLKEHVCTKRVFESNNRTIAALMTKIYEVRDLKAQQLVASNPRTTGPLASAAEAEPEQLRPTPAVQQTKHITCFVALPFNDEYDILLEALRDVLEVAPYFWQVERADSKYFKNSAPNNVGEWIARSQCYIVDISESNESVMMELGHMYWGYQGRSLIVLHRDGIQRRIADLDLLRIAYPWADSPNQTRIANALRREFEKFDELKELKVQAHYLSVRLIRSTVRWIQADVADAVAERYSTVEEFVGKDAAASVQDLGSIVPVSVVQDIQSHLRKTCGLK